MIFVPLATPNACDVKASNSVDLLFATVFDCVDLLFICPSRNESLGPLHQPDTRNHHQEHRPVETIVLCCELGSFHCCLIPGHILSSVSNIDSSSEKYFSVYCNDNILAIWSRVEVANKKQCIAKSLRLGKFLRCNYEAIFNAAFRSFPSFGYSLLLVC